MKEELISFETAKLAKEKGFNIPTLSYWFKSAGYMSICGGDEKYIKDKWYLENLIISDDYYGANLSLDDFADDHNNKILDKRTIEYHHSELISAPTQSLLQKWLREIHGIHVIIMPKILPNNEIWYYIYKWMIKKDFNDLYGTYEEALEIGLNEVLKTNK